MTNTVIEVDSLNYTYDGSKTPILKNLSFKIKQGDFTILLGPSGCGKSTLVRCLIGLIPHFYSGKLKGNINVLGSNTISNNIYTLSQKVGIVFQNPDNQIVMTTVDRDVAFGLENLNLPSNNMKKKVISSLNLLGLEKLIDSPISNLSGGQKQKLAISGIIAMDPKILILDEPTAYFSPSSALDFFNLLQSLNKEKKLTIILIEHRLDLACKYADKILAMDAGKLFFDGKPKDFFENLSHEKNNINLPKLISIYNILKKNNVKLDSPPLSPDEAVNHLKKLI